ncbi:MAG: TIGR00730 family Rossman fold protein [Acidimicrobiales bacterium]
MIELTRVAVFCGSSPGRDPAFEDLARELGALLAHRRIGLVYGGGNVGLMGTLADAVLAGGGHVTGVIPEHLWAKEVGHLELQELLVVGSMHERKLAMADRADAFIAMPGGVGTFEEMFEAITWTQLGIHHKPMGILDAGGFYQPLLRFLDQTVAAGFLRQDGRDIVVSSSDPAELLGMLERWEGPSAPPWLSPEER